MAWKEKWPVNWILFKKLNENHILDLFISVTLRHMKKMISLCDFPGVNQI